jgi:hypothetical protein
MKLTGPFPYARDSLGTSKRRTIDVFVDGPPCHSFSSCPKDGQKGEAVSGFKFDSNQFKRELAQQVQSAVDDIGRQLERGLSSLSRTHAGQPLAMVKGAIQREFRKHDWTVTDPELTEYAEAIRAGKTIKVNVEKVRF